MQINHSNNNPSFGMALSVSKGFIDAIASMKGSDEILTGTLPKLKELCEKQDVFLTTAQVEEGLFAVATPLMPKTRPYNGLVAEDIKDLADKKFNGLSGSANIRSVQKEGLTEENLIDAVKAAISKFMNKEQDLKDNPLAKTKAASMEKTIKEMYN